MKRAMGCVLMLAAGMANAQSMESTLEALKDPQAPRGALSVRLTEDIMLLAKSNQAPAQASVQRFSDELTRVLLGKDVTKARASELRKAIGAVLSGKGSTFLPANSLYETLRGCGIEDRAMQTVLDRFREIGQEVRGPDDVPLQKFK